MRPSPLSFLSVPFSLLSSIRGSRGGRTKNPRSSKRQLYFLFLEKVDEQKFVYAYFTKEAPCQCIECIARE